MAWSFDSTKPIFQQIVDRITLEIVAGRYEPGQRLETVRDLAITVGVNPNTMQRALAALEDTGLVYTKRGDGRFVTEDDALIRRALEQYVSECCSQLVDTLRKVGLNDEEVLESIKQVLNKGTGEEL
ncbi:MAG: GntR family transcriptional regulator [Clostridia bacterium]|nr:GntR family transcriptional regulator [Clostridia bacterium]